MNEIQDRYFHYNAHAGSYTWKYDGKNLDMKKTLQRNEVKDECEEFYKLGLDEEQYLPALHLYFNDDLTEAWPAVSIWSVTWTQTKVRWLAVSYVASSASQRFGVSASCSGIIGSFAEYVLNIEVDLFCRLFGYATVVCETSEFFIVSFECAHAVESGYLPKMLVLLFFRIFSGVNIIP